MSVTRENEPEPQAPNAPNSDELLRAIVESATDFAIFAIDPIGKVVSWNVGAERLTGYSYGEMIGRSADIRFTEEDRAAGEAERERCTARDMGRSEDERWHQRKDGSRFWGSGLMMPLRGATEGFLKILRDRTDTHRANEALRASEVRFRILATSIPQLVFRSRGTGERTWGSPQWESFTGLSDLRSREYGWLDGVHPDDRELTIAAWRDAQRTGEYHVEHRIKRVSDGEYRWHQTRAARVQQERREPDEWVGTSADIHDLRALHDRQRVLLAELQHRTRNLLAMIQAMARQTARLSGSLQEFQHEFEGRLRALARVQGLLARTDQNDVELRAIIEAEFAAHRDGQRKIDIQGPALLIPPNSAQALALALHELTTNAVKYGALNQPTGELSVRWRLEDDGPARPLVLDA